MSDAANPRVLVMMATYNGEKYVAEQIESILAQEGVEVYLLISDDGSTDSTCKICEQYARDYASVTFRRNKANKGLALNFMDMVYDCDRDSFDYFAFSDQDDYWLPDKIKQGVLCLDSVGGPGPLLYYSDVLNVDRELCNPRPEYYPFISISDELGPLLVCNYASGCTMVFNRELADFLNAHQPSEYPRIHDVWIHLVAKACGTVYSDLGRSFIYRRISGDNQVGERDFGVISFSRLFGMVRNLLQGPSDDSVFYKTSHELMECCRDEMDPDSKRTIEMFLGTRSGLAARIKCACNKEFRMPSRIDTVALKARILLGFY